MTLEKIIFYLLLLDSLTANVVAWFEIEWYKKYFPWFAQKIPLTKGWALYYLALVLWIGFLVFFR